VYSALFMTSEVLRRYLLAQLQATPGLGFGGARVVSLNSPRELREEQRTEGLSLWLYRIIRDETRLNIRPRHPQPDQIQPPPLPLCLHYLMTPVTFSNGTGGAPDIEQRIMGRVLQALHGRPILRGLDLAGTDFEGMQIELHARLETLALDEMSRIWEALEGSYQLSLSYEVSVVNIESAVAPVGVAPVQVALPEFGVVVGS
jgi:Pvc16 N-terminal domain